MRTLDYDVDICVMGAGPAGSVTAKRLADLGHSVCLVESKKFPRFHIGICLSDETYTLLDYLGAQQEVEAAAFLKRKNSLVYWETTEPLNSPQPGFHVDRGQFDQILLKNAQAAGVEVLQPARVKGVKQWEEGWTVKMEVAGERKELRVRFVVDATGNGNILPAKKVRMAPPLFALHGKWTLKEMPASEGIIEAGKDAWMWFAQVNDQEAFITLFTDPKHFLKSKDQGLKMHYLEMLQQFSLLRSCSLGQIVGEIKPCEAGSRYTTDPVGPTHIKVGDANIKVDPIAAQGVHLAILGGLQAAIVVNTILHHPQNQEQAIAFYRSRQQERIRQFTQKTAEVYAQVADQHPHPFWKQRAEHESLLPPSKAEPAATWPELSQLLQLSKQAKILSIPIMQEQIIVSAPALHHPSLDRPVAYVGGKNIVSLLLDLQKGCSAETLLQAWGKRMTQELSLQILSWLWSREILAPLEK